MNLSAAFCYPRKSYVLKVDILRLDQAEEIMRKTLKEAASVDRWTAAQCLAYYGECDSEVVGELVSQMLNTEDSIRYERAAHLLARLSETSVSFHNLCHTNDPFCY